MLPDVVRTGTVNINERGFTAYFSVDSNSHSFSVKYYDDWKEFPDHLKKYVAELACSLWVASIPCQRKVFTHRLSQPDIDFLKFIVYQTQGTYRRAMRYPALEPKPKMYVTMGERDWSDMTVEDDKYTVMVDSSVSSVATIAYMDDLGYDHDLVSVNTGPDYESSQKIRDELDVKEIWTNFPMVKREVTKDHDVYWDCEAPRYTMSFIVSIPLITKGCVLFPNHYPTTRFDNFGGDKLLNHDWEKSVIANRRLTSWARESKMLLRVGSIVRGLSYTKMVSDLTERYEEFWEYVKPCEHTSNEGSPCSRCFNCHRHYLVSQALGVGVGKYDLSKIRDTKPEAHELINGGFAENELAHINYLTGAYPNYPDVEMEEVTGVMFSKMTPYRYMFTKREIHNILRRVKYNDSAYINYNSTWVETKPNTALNMMRDIKIPEMDVDVIVKENKSLLKYD